MHANVKKPDVAPWSLEIKRRFPLTSPLTEADVADWQAEVIRMVGSTEKGELSDTILWAAYRHGNDRPATPQDLVTWIRERRFEKAENDRQKAYIPEPTDECMDNDQRNNASEAVAKCVRAWLMERGSRGYEDGYRRLTDEEAIEPTDEFYSETYKQWAKVGDGCMRYRHMRRKR